MGSSEQPPFDVGRAVKSWASIKGHPKGVHATCALLVQQQNIVISNARA